MAKSYEFEPLNEKLFASVEKIAAASHTLLSERVGRNVLLEEGGLAYLKSSLADSPHLRDLDEAFQSQNALRVDQLLRTDIFDGADTDDLSPGKQLSAAAGFVMLGGLDGPSKLWTPVEQVRADIEDELCLAFGKVRGYRLDYLSATTVQLNSDPDRKNLMKVIAFRKGAAPFFRLQDYEATEVLLEGNLMDHLNGDKSVIQLANRVCSRLHTLIRRLPSTKPS